MTSINFPRYYGGSVDIDMSVLESAMRSESLCESVRCAANV